MSAEFRLRAVPWDALAGVVPDVAAALSDVLHGKAAERVLDRLLRVNRGWPAERRQAVAEAVFGVGLWRRRLAARIGHADTSGAAPERLLWAFLVDLAGVSPADAARMCGTSTEDLRALPDDFAVRCSLPDWLARTLRAELGESAAAAFAEAINIPGPVFARANPLRTTRAALLERLSAEGGRATALDATALAFRFDDRPNIYGLPSHQAGLFEVQDLGSQLLGELVGASAGESVLDFCAGAGGKTVQLAGAVGPTGRVHAFDVDRARLDRLEVRAARAGATQVRIHRSAVPPDLRVDRVLVDAPCSELGILRRGPDVRWRLDPATFLALPALQRDILDSASKHVRPGGRLVYATCTLRSQENAEVADAFESAHPQLTRTPPSGVPAAFVAGHRFVALPHLHGTDGFFATVWERRG